MSKPFQRSEQCDPVEPRQVDLFGAKKLFRALFLAALIFVAGNGDNNKNFIDQETGALVRADWQERLTTEEKDLGLRVVAVLNRLGQRVTLRLPNCDPCTPEQQKNLHPYLLDVDISTDPKHPAVYCKTNGGIEKRLDLSLDSALEAMVLLATENQETISAARFVFVESQTSDDGSFEVTVKISPLVNGAALPVDMESENSFL